MNILRTNDLKKYYGEEPVLVKALDGITMEIEQGSFTAVVGTRSEERRVAKECAA